MDSIQARECSSLQDIFYIQESCSFSSSSLEQASLFSLRHPLYLILGQQEEEENDDDDADTIGGLQNVADTLWKHDSELGRGYLLLSQSYKNGRMWRFVVGGGPVPIGKHYIWNPPDVVPLLTNHVTKKKRTMMRAMLVRLLAIPIPIIIWEVQVWRLIFSPAKNIHRKEN